MSKTTEMADLIKFVILAAPRTGSNMLCTLLDSHPKVLCHHEIFNPNGIFYALALREGSFSLGTIVERDHDPLGFLERVWVNSLSYSCVGFKTTHRQNETVLRAVLADSTIKKIVLKRNNQVKTYVSRLIAEQTGTWEAYQSSDLSTHRPKVYVDVTALQEHIAINYDYYADIETSMHASHQSFLEVTYENLLSSQEQLRLIEFLGVSLKETGHSDGMVGNSAFGFNPVSPLNQGGLEVKSIKQNSKNLRDLVSNYDQLEIALRGTKLEAQLYSLVD